MSRSRRAGLHLRPGVENLEGRLALAASALSGASLNFRPVGEGLYSQQSQTADIKLSLQQSGPRREAIPVCVTTVDGPNGGTAIVGKQYLPINETLTFQPGETTKTISVPIVTGAENPGQVTVALQATALTSDAPTAAIKITLDKRADMAGPRITRSRLIVNSGQVEGITLTFSELMDRRTVERKANYTVWDYSHKPTVGDWFSTILTSGKKNAFQPIPVALKAALYDEMSKTVTLVPRRRLLVNGQYDVTSGFRAPFPNVKPRQGGPADLQGNLLGYFHVSVGTPNKANDAGAKTANVLSKLPHL